MLSLSFWITLVFAVLTVAGVYGIVQSHKHREMYGRKKRGVEPGAGRAVPMRSREEECVQGAECHPSGGRR